jgi:hypothetical protein
LERLKRVFLLSPANAGGTRARQVLAERAQFSTAVRLRTEGAPIGELYTFISGLYFRGKMAYAEAFADPPGRASYAVVITPNRGMLPPHTPVTMAEFRDMAGVDIHHADDRYRIPLLRDAIALRDLAGPECAFILLGSVATPKYVEPFLDIFGDRLLFPPAFVGRGDMSRGGLMLRAARSGEELEYVPVWNAVRHGPRPPKLPKQ